MKKYIKTFESFREKKNSEPINEEFLGAIGKWLGNMFKKAQENIRKTKGGEEIEVIYKKYLKMINDSFQKQANVTLNLGAAVDAKAKKEKAPKEEAPKEEAPKEEVTTEGKINEATYSEKDVTMSPETLKEKKAVMDQIVLKMKEMALKEMDSVLKKYGGSSKNPKLQVIIDVKKSQFDLDYMNAKISYLESAGDESMKKIVEKERDAIAKVIAGEWKKFDVKPKAKVDDTEKKEFDVSTLEDGDKITYKKKADPEGNDPKPATFVKLDGDNVLVKTDGNKNGFPIQKSNVIGKVEEENTEETPKEETE
jgi:hypothetical protein